jgi:sugar/nucleoside kinase (ribokinase family)
MMDAAPREVVCVGILVADIFIPPLARLPAAGELLASGDFLIDSGGCAANVATSLVKLDVTATAVGKVGSDHFGSFIQQDLTQKGINTVGIARSERAGTSKTVILPVIGEDRRYIHTFGANADFTAADIDRALLDGARVLYVGGYLVLPGLDATELGDLFRYARQKGVITVLDVVVPSEHDNADFAALLKPVLPYVDYFMPNDEEAHALTGESDPQQQAEQFLALGCTNAIITKGKYGTLLANKRETLEIPSFTVEVVDSSGAGDAFAAGFIVGLLEGWETAQMLRFASAIGAAACTRLGCTDGVFNRDQAQEFLASTISNT